VTGTVTPEVMSTDVDVVRVPVGDAPVAVMRQVVPGTALVGMVIVTVKPPVVPAVTVSVSSPHRFSVTVAPGLYPVPVKVIVPPGGADPELEVKPPQFVAYGQLAAAAADP
jgi:hypothetical protein